MVKIEIKELHSVNGIPFFSSKEHVRKAFGPDYTNSFDSTVNSKEENDTLSLLEEKIKEVYEEMGKDPNSFEWPDLSQFESDVDRYSFFDLEYDKQGRFVSITLVAGKTKLVINGNECTDFEISKLLKLADDFVWDDLNTAYTSHSKQIGIWCPKGKNKADSITFGCPDYYDFLNEE